ncbi:hypothetical protein NXX91_22350 [Bacteroides thetaiotaomicron]|nr:hypothetical protein [Bacteroides thetaiotaomicron]
MSRLHVKAGTHVRIGQHIGDVGHTGGSDRQPPAF